MYPLNLQLPSASNFDSNRISPIQVALKDGRFLMSGQS